MPGPEDGKNSKLLRGGEKDPSCGGAGEASEASEASVKNRGTAAVVRPGSSAPSCGGGALQRAARPGSSALVAPGAAAFAEYLETESFGAEKMLYLTHAYQNYKGDKDGYARVSQFIRSLEECPSFVFYTSDGKPSVKLAPRRLALLQSQHRRVRSHRVQGGRDPRSLL